MKLRGENRKDTKDSSKYMHDTPPEIKGKNALKRSPSKGAYRLHGVKCTRIHWKNLSPKEQEMIQKLWEEAEEDEQFWDRGQFGSVSKPDVKALLEGSSINSNVVNAYIDIIKGDLEKSGIRNQGIMTTYVLVEAVTTWMLNVKKLHKQNKERRLKFVRVEKKTTIYEEIQIDENVEKTIAWINKTDVDNLKLVEDMYCAQQPDNSLDCGPYILHYIENIAKNMRQISKADRGVSVDKVLGLEREIKESLKNMRRMMVGRFLNHDEGWYSKVGYTK